MKPEDVIRELDELAVIKRCTRCHAEYTIAGWKKLPLVGYQEFEGEPTLELRNCGCRSTIAIEV